MVTREGLDRVLAELQLAEKGHLVDLCCGRGGVGLWLASQSAARVTGVDFSPEAIGQARRRRSEHFPDVGATFLVADAGQTPIESGSADAIVCIDSLQLVPERDHVVCEMARLLRPGGRAVITTWERDEGFAGRTPIRDAGVLVESNGLHVIAREEHPEWMDRQTTMFERVIAEDGEDAEPAVRRLAEEGRTMLPLTATTRRVLVIATSES